MKTLYEVLEVSEKASKEVIEKAYKVLVKKYHPDLQDASNKEEADKKMKEINEAYSILSDEIAREKYDEELKMQKQQEESKTYNNYTENSRAKNNQTEQDLYKKQEEILRQQEMYMKKQQEEYVKQQKEMESRYNKAYYNYLKSLGYKVKYKWTWKQYLTLLIIIAVIILIGLILWIIPPTHHWMVGLYEENVIIRVTVNVIIGFFNGIGRIISSIFGIKN